MWIDTDRRVQQGSRAVLLLCCGVNWAIDTAVERRTILSSASLNTGTFCNIIQSKHRQLCYFTNSVQRNRLDCIVAVAIALRSMAIVMICFVSMSVVRLLSVVCLSVSRVYCDKTTEARITVKSGAISQFLAIQFGAQSGLGWFATFFSGNISRKQCKTEPRSQLLTNRKSYVGFRLE